MIIYNSSGVPIIDIEVDDASYCYRALMRSDELTLVFSLTEHVELPVGAYCTFEASRYYLMALSNVTVHHRRNYEYTVRMNAPMELTKSYVIYNIVDKRLQFEQSGTPREHLQQIIDNLNAREGSGWTIGTCIEADPKILAYSYTTCWDGIAQIAAAFNSEFEINGREVSIRKVEYHKGGPLRLAYGAGNGLRSGIKRLDASMGIGRVFIQGGDRNIGLDNYDSKTLHLPKAVTVNFNGTDFIESGGVSMTTSEDGLSVALTGSASNVTEASLDLSHIYPSRVGTVSNVVYEYKKKYYSYEGLVETFPDLTEDDWLEVYTHFCDDSIPAELDYDACLMGNGEPLTVIFQGDRGMLLGREFNVTFNKAAKTRTVDGMDVVVIPANRFEIEHASIDGVDMPNGTYRPVAGDKYAIFNCALPQTYINAGELTKEGAEWDALKAAAKFLYENREPKVSYKGDLDPLFAKGDWLAVGDYLKCGSYISFSDPAVQSEPVLVRIVGVRQPVNNPQAPTIEFSNEAVSATLSSAIKQLQANAAHIEALSKQNHQYASRSFSSTKETMRMLIEAALDGFTDAINPVAVQTMQMVVGDERLQFLFFEDSGCNVATDPVHYDSAARQVSFDAAYLKHMTLGIDAITPEHPLSEYKVWAMTQATSAVLSDPDARYYMYAVVDADTSVPGTYVLVPAEQAALPLERKETAGGQTVVVGYNLLIGFLNSEAGGERSYARMYGFSEVLPGQITTDKIRSTNGLSWIDLSTNQMYFGDASKSLSWNLNNSGELKVDGGKIVSSLIQLGMDVGGAYAVLSGINGIADETLEHPERSIAAWFGGPMVDKFATTPAPQDYAKSLFRMDGTGYLAGGNIVWNPDGSGSVAGGNLSWDSQGVPTIAGGVTIDGTNTSLADMLAAMFHQKNATLQTLVELKPAYSYIGAKNGIFFAGATLTGTPVPDLYVDTVNGQRVLRSPLPLITGGDQIVISGTPGGGGGGGSTYLHDLLDVYGHDSGVVKRFNGSVVSSTDILGYDSAKGWYAIQLGSNLSLTNGVLSATGGGGGGASNLYQMSDVYGGSSSVLDYDGMPAYQTDLFGYDSIRGWYAVHLGANLSLVDGVLSATGGGGGSVSSIKIGTTPYSPDASGVVSLPAYPADENVKQTNTTGSSAYRVLLSYSANNTTATEGTRKSGNLTFNPSTGALTVSGAVNGLTLAASSAGFTIAGGTATSKTLTVSETLGLTGTNGTTYDLSTISSYATNGNTAYGYFTSGVLGAAHGGTGYSAYTKGNIIYASGASALSLLAPNSTSTKKFLTMTSSTPAWGTIEASDISISASYLFGSSAIGSTSRPVYYTGSTLAGITDLDLLAYANGYVKANRVYLTSSVYFTAETVSGTVCVKLNAPLITTGDQIVISGTPGGGGGGSSTLQGLDDTQIPSNPALITDGYVLTWVAADQKWEPKAGAGAVTSVVGQTGAVTATQIATALTSAGYKLTDTVYSLPLAASGTRGGIQIGYSESGTNYAVKLSSEKAYVSVPWTDAKVTQTATTTSAAYEILFSGSANNTTATEGARKTSTLTYNPSTKALSTGGAVNGLTFTTETEGFTISGGTLSRTLTVKGMEDSTSASYIGTSQNIVTERDIYYGLPTINNSHTYNSSTAIYAPTSAGTSGYWLKASGGTSAPVWESMANMQAGKDGDGNTISSTYLKLAGGTMTGAIKLTATYGLQDTSSRDIFVYSSTSSPTLSIGHAGVSGASVVIRSYNNNLTHRKYTSSSAYTDNAIWDAANSNLATVAWACSELSIGSSWQLGLSSTTLNWYYSSTSVASLSSSGLFSTSGDQVVSSDIALKKNLKDICYTVEDIARCRAVTFDWKDGRGRSAGSIAQDWLRLIPELVHGKEGGMSLAYGQLALVNTILIARHETEQNMEIRMLKERVAELEHKVKRLTN